MTSERRRAGNNDHADMFDEIEAVSKQIGEVSDQIGAIDRNFATHDQRSKDAIVSIVRLSERQAETSDKLSNNLSQLTEISRMAFMQPSRQNAFQGKEWIAIIKWVVIGLIGISLGVEGLKLLFRMMGLP